MVKRKSKLTIAVLSRTDIGGPGTRNNLIRAGFRRARDEGSDFIIWAGGVVNHKALNEKLHQETDELTREVKEHNLEAQKKDRLDLRQEIADHREVFIRRWVKKVSSLVPELKTPTGERISINIITAPYFDGKLGQEIVTRLVQIRPDIRYLGEYKYRFPLRVFGDNRWLSVLVPRRPPWRGKYHSTAITREIEDISNVPDELSDFYVVGCCGTSITKPKGGESKRPYFSVPVLHKLQDVSTAENQIGIRIFNVEEESGELVIIPRMIDAKDLVIRERKSLRLPASLSKNQRKTMELVISQGEQSVGSISDHLDLDEVRVRRLLDKLDQKSDLSGRVLLDPRSGRFDFTEKFLVDNLNYRFPEYQDLTQETIITFACMHAGHTQLNHRMMTDDIPREIYRTGATVLAGAGDLVCGLKHDLILRGEAYGGLNETMQEKFAAHLVSQAMLGSFTLRLRDRIRANKAIVSDINGLKKVISDDLVSFWYIPGNHCAWTLPFGISPLETFSYVLRDKLIAGLHQIMSGLGVNLFEFIHEMADRKVSRGSLFTLPKTGLTGYMCHPSMGRTKTISIRPQEVAARIDAAEAQIVIDGNFHVGMTLEQWLPGLSQRVIHQVGTLLKRTDFEDSKIKDVDQHFGVIRVWAKDKKIKVSETYYHGPNTPEIPLDNDHIRLALENQHLFRL